MDLTDVQKDQVRKWVEEGDGLSAVQQKLSEEFGISMTYMDVRFLVLDLGAEVKDKAQPEPKVPAEEPVDESPSLPDAATPSSGDAGAGGSGNVTVEIDRITKPGSAASGTVVFGDGTRATWMVDALGRLALDAGSPDYRPSEEDLMDFQMELQKAFSARGL